MGVEYTAEVVKGMVDRYVSAVEAGANYDERVATVVAIAKELGLSAKQVQGKLVSEGVYKGKEKASTQGASGATKDEICNALSVVVGSDMSSLANANKVTLENLWKFFVDQSNSIEVRAQELAEVMVAQRTQ